MERCTKPMNGYADFTCQREATHRWAVDGMTFYRCHDHAVEVSDLDGKSGMNAYGQHFTQTVEKLP